jgi:LmbE family N-acetylglucosaminyl deacetylase
MIALDLKKSPATPLTVLCLGAHSDDIEIGCGGTILRLAEQYPGTKFHWVVFSAAGERKVEASQAAELFAAGGNLQEPLLKTFRDGFLPFLGAEVKEVFEELKGISPDVIFTPRRKDAHQDHRLVGELTWNTFRDHWILEYEIPKYDGDMGQPNVYVPLEERVAQKKVDYLVEIFKSQHSRRWFQEGTFLSLLRIRGIECNAPSSYAEAFYCRKSVL